MADLKPSKHGRDHCPGGEDPIPCLTSSIPCFRAYMWDHSLTIANNSDAFLEFDRYEVSDSAAFAPGAWTPGTPDYIDTVGCLVRGLYLVHIFVDVFPLGGKVGLAIEDAGGTFTGPPTVILDNTNRAGDGTTGSLSWTTAMSFPPIWIEQTTDTLAPDLPDMKFKLLNLTGGSRDISHPCMVEVHRLFAFDYETLTVESQA